MTATAPVSAPPAPAAPPAPPAPAASTLPRGTSERPPFRLVLTILHLGAFGLFGFATIGILAGMLGAGIGLIFVLGIGLFILLGWVYALFGLAWFETERVNALYRLDIPTLRRNSIRGQGFKAYLGSIVRQLIDGRMWRALASFAVASLVGAIVVGLFQVMIWGIFGNADGYGVSSLAVRWAAILLAPAAIVGAALLYRVIAISIVSAGIRNAELRSRADVAGKQREGAVRAADVERTRIERDLHDGVQPRLVSVAMTLGLAQQSIDNDNDPEYAKALIGEAHTSTKAAITELRQLARGIYASVLDDRGLDAALSALAGRSPIPVLLDVQLPGRCHRNAETAVYFAIAESLTNAAKHSRASESRVVVRSREDGMLWVRVEDNGIGGAHITPGGGLDGIMNRLTAAGGTARLDSPHGGPTSLEVSVPCAS